MKYFIRFIFFLISLYGFSQDNLILDKSIQLTIQNNNRGLSIKEHNSQSTKILNQNNNGLSETIYHSSIKKILKREAWTEYLGKKGRIKKLHVDNWENASVDSRGVFFSGREKLSFDYPKAEQFSICKVNYVYQISEPQFVTSYYLSDNSKIENYTLSISYPSDLDLHFELRNCDSLQIVESVEKSDFEIKKTINIKNIQSFKGYDKIESPLYYSPHILVRIKSYTNKGKKIMVGESPKDLYNWYSRLVKQIPEADSEDYKNEMEAKATELTKGVVDDEKKASIIYKWVQKNIKYIAFEDGMNGFIPRNAYNIFYNRYGDCKDMANLIKTMLESIGIKAYLTWIGTREKPYSYDEVPGVNTDNHMICSIKLDDDFIFLDATNENIKFKGIAKGIQGKQSLIGLTDSTFILWNVPIAKKESTTRTDSFNLILNEKELLSTFSTDLSGYFKDNFVDIEQLGKFRRDKGFYLDYLNIGKSGYSSSDPEVFIQDESSRVELNAKFENKIIQAGSKIYVNLHLNNLYDNLKVDNIKERKIPIHEDHKYMHNIHTSFMVPQGYSLSSKLNKMEYINKYFAYKQTIELINGELKMHQYVEINFIELQPELFPDYEMFLDSIKQSELVKLKFEKK